MYNNLATSLELKVLLGYYTATSTGSKNADFVMAYLGFY